MGKVTEEILEYVQDMSFRDIPKSTVDHIKVHFLDTIGAMIAGSSAQCAKKLLRMIQGEKGPSGCTVFVYGQRVKPWEAALFNSTMARGYDYEPILLGGATHVPASIIPASLVVAEYSETVKNKPVNGEELITSVVVGLDLAWRIRVAGRGKKRTDLGSGWLAETFVPIAIAALGSRLLKFGKKRTNHAMAIAFAQCSGHYGATVGKGGGLMAQLSQGLGTKAGVTSLLFAEMGFTAQRDIFEGRWGLYSLFGDGEYDREALIGGLGNNFRHLEPFVKRYPGCGALQAPVEATVRLVNSENVILDEVEEVRVKLDPLSFHLVAEDKRRLPESSADALWNCYYAVAVALRKGTISLQDFTETGINTMKGKNLAEVIRKVKIFPTDEQAVKMGAEVEVRKKNGVVLREVVEKVEPVAGDNLLQKFRTCCEVSAKKFSLNQIENILQATRSLESLNRASEFLALLVAEDQK